VYGKYFYPDDGSAPNNMWSFTLTVPSGKGGNGGSTNVARSGGAGGGAPSSSSTAYPFDVTHAGVAGQGITTYNTFPTATAATGVRQCSGGGAGGGVLNTGIGVVNGRSSGAIAVPAGVTAIIAAANRVALGGIGDAVSGYDGIELLYETGASSSGGGGGAGQTTSSTSFASAGGKGGTGAGGGGSGASKATYSRSGGDGGSGYVIISWW